MSNLAKLKKRALEYEQKKQLDKALETYLLVLEQLNEVVEESDMALYNRVGDLLLRRGDVSDAVDHYEKAVDLYTDGGFFNNAIALCNKILRNAPGRNSVYYKLGKISARKGFTNDAKQNFLEYADRMQKAGQLEEAFRALKEFADLCPDQDDIRLMLADQLVRKNRKEEAIEQLQLLHEKYQTEGRTQEAQAALARMKALDPSVEPRAAGIAPTHKAGDLIFLDVNYDGPNAGGAPKAKIPTPGRASAPAEATPKPAAPVVPSPSFPDVSEPSLDPGDSISLEAEEVPLTVEDAEQLDGGEPLPGISHGAALTEDEGVTANIVSHVEPEFITGFEQTAQSVSESDLDNAEQIAPVIELEPTALTEDPIVAESLIEDSLIAEEVSAASALDDAPDVDSLAHDPAVPEPSLMDEMPLEEEGLDSPIFAGELPPEREHHLHRPEHDLALPGDLPSLDLPLEEVESDPLDSDLLLYYPEDDEEPIGGSLPLIDTEDEQPASLGQPSQETSPGEHDSSLERSESDGDDESAGSPLHLIYPDEEPLTPLVGHAISHTDLNYGDAEESSADSTNGKTPADRQKVGAVPSLLAADLATGRELPLDQDASGDTADGAADTGADAAAEPEPEPVPLTAVARLQRQIEHAPDDWQLHRRLGEAMLEEGDRRGGLRQLESAMLGFERSAHLADAGSLADELVRLEPNSVRYHQKRVEYAVRSNDKVRLGDAYLQLADSLFRSGQMDKARAVYARVLEMFPDDGRALTALRSFAPAGGTPASIPRVAAKEDVPPGASNGASPSDESAPAPPPEVPRSTRTPSAPMAAVASAPTGPSESFVNLAEWLRDARTPPGAAAPAGQNGRDEQVDFDEMLTRFKQGVAASVDETDHESHYDLGVAYKEMGLLDEAIAEFQKALRGADHRVRTYEALGQCFVEKRQYQVALTVLTRALKENSTDETLVGVLYLLGYASEALQRWGDAQQHYERVFAVDIQFRDIGERLAAIERNTR